MARTRDLQIDVEIERLCMGLPALFVPVATFGAGLSPLSLPGAANLQSWHLSQRGVSLGSGLVPSGPGTPPVCSFTANVAQSVPFRQDVLVGGVRGVATYGLTIDGGLSYFQTG